MDFAQQQRNPAKHLAGITFVIVFHLVLVYALVTGLGHKLVEVIKKPYETKIVKEVKKLPPPDTPPPPPPKLAPPPPPYIPPPEINIAAAGPATNAITQFTSKVAITPPTPARAAPVHTPPVINAKRSCAEPAYPASSRRLEESGTVLLRFLIDESGKVIESKVESSSGFDRLDKAAKEALSRCQFQPGTVDGKPEKSWASLKYIWRLQ